MARTRSTSENHEQHSGESEAHRPGNGHAAVNGLPGMPDWLKAPMTDPKKAVDTMLEMQRQWLKTASTSSETLAMELKELQQAKDPAEFVSAQVALANQQLEILARQVAAVMQQIYDAQLMWLGQWDEKAAAMQSASSAEESASTAFSALTKMQDDWLKMTQSWIDSINSAGSSR